MHESQCQTPQQVKLSAMHPEGLTHQRVHVHCMASLTESESLAVDQKLLFLLHSVRTRAIMPQTCSDPVHSCGCYSISSTALQICNIIAKIETTTVCHIYASLQMLHWASCSPWKSLCCFSQCKRSWQDSFRSTRQLLFLGSLQSL